MSAFVTTTFAPDPACIATDHIWLRSQDCYSLPFGDSPTREACTYFQHGHQQARETNGDFISDSCLPYWGDRATVYTDCPSGYNAVVETSTRNSFHTVFEKQCCPSAFEYSYNVFGTFTTETDGVQQTWSLYDVPKCVSTRIEEVHTEVITVTLGEHNNNEPTATTTTEIKDGNLVFAEAVGVIGPTVYGGGYSECWDRCPYSYEPTPTFEEKFETAPAVTQFSAPSHCLDPENKWIVTTSCYITDAQYTPDWLTCSVTHFGAPNWDNDECYQNRVLYDSPSVVVEGTTSWYSGCPSGYTIASSTIRPFSDEYRHPIGYFDVTTHLGLCCPTAYKFQEGEVKQTETVHDGATYGLFVYAPPRCYATSIEPLSGKEVVLSQWSNTQAWDKRDEDGGPTTVTWNFEHDTMYAMAEQFSYEVFKGTHTCYSPSYTLCSSWLSYYYPDGVGGETPDGWTSPVATITSAEEESGGFSSHDSSSSPFPLETGEGTLTDNMPGSGSRSAGGGSQTGGAGGSSNGGSGASLGSAQGPQETGNPPSAAGRAYGAGSIGLTILMTALAMANAIW
ncbi:hypothetical protein BU24DRAFT_423462 [Aaosphaeria arxii CBS 175.79]|uniref:Uncharacterized protein n=1 Tax=Aaosphaeria arxii CBS 175.79 TaxID=1450172 RepID=A0A6A5XNR5_9PLEO|nr:uncharacterized protein BU24DRAFT_423462 [Aaosphaeria arxii CBS 175.79]KAF2014539.1 hypothetical protein BU24DRAFT_423462 [Aaosphaeria arxii CBS 175.79]